MFKDLEGQAKAIISRCWEIAYFMRGGIQYSEVMELTHIERKQALAFLDKRMEIEGKKPIGQQVY